MNKPFKLPVSYKGEEIIFPALLKQYGYTYSIVVDVYGQEVFFEPDEERTYRAVTNREKLNKEITVDLLKTIAENIEPIVK